MRIFFTKIKKVICILFFLVLFLNINAINGALAQVGTTSLDVPTSVNIIIVCGDGFKTIEEVCDKGDSMHIPPISADFGGLTCTDYEYASGSPYTAGFLTCATDCQSILTTMCSHCPNGIKEGLEECDGSDFGGSTCRSFGFAEGTLSCTASCHLNLENCVSADTGAGGTPGGNPGKGGGSSGGTTGYNPGSDVPQQETKIVIQGKAYPNVDVHILLDGKIVGIVKADANANFTFETKDVTPGTASLGFWAEDSAKIKSTTVTLTFKIINGAVTTLSGAFLAPTIMVDKTGVSKGESVVFSGQTIPNAEIILNILPGTNLYASSTSATNGNWAISYNTSALKDNEQYNAKALFQALINSNTVRSGYGKSVIFNVGKGTTEKKCAGADLNGDKRVNLTDFSILLYYWGTNNACADQNSDGKVNLTDFSIMMYNWTG